MRPRPSLRLCAPLLALVPAAAGAESLGARGIIAGEPLVLLAEVHSCPVDGPPAAQLLVSPNEGRTWWKRGPALEGAQFEYAAATPRGLWVVGLRAVEGPGTDPFVLVPDQGPTGWTAHAIFEGPAELLGAARAKETLSVWIRHIDIDDQRWRGPIHLHRSTDGGRTWTDLGRSRPRTAGFQKVARRQAGWRLADRPDGGFDVQRQAGQTWQSVAQFPWRPCG